MRETPLVKICGLRRREDVVMADEQGADFLGVVMTSGFSRSVEPRAAHALMDGVRARPVAVLVDESADEAERMAEALGAHVIQLHGREPPEVLESLARRGHWSLWKGVRARTVDDVVGALDEYRGLADGLLLEGWKEGVVGGGGVRLELEPEPVHEHMSDAQYLILAGGLTPATVRAAVARFRPDVVDVSSGVESEVGEKDPELVHAFISAARSASSAAAHPSEQKAPP
ncbi:MAG: phosphoribosylanthranilate isomerase [Gemmatimonadota bacterium]|nr:phosphoribosylanthranilate isomerase [Gemmatimonadota bacterium]